MQGSKPVFLRRTAMTEAMIEGLIREVRKGKIIHEVFGEAIPPRPVVEPIWTVTRRSK